MVSLDFHNIQYSQSYQAYTGPVPQAIKLINAHPLTSSMPTWFRKGIDTSTIISLDQHVLSQWKIVQKLNEHDFQLTEAEYQSGCRLSFATTKLLCRDPKDHTMHAFMRIYLQVLYQGTETDDANTRASQATTIIPQELVAYQELTQLSSNTLKLVGHETTTQDQSGSVPGGFVV